MIIGVIGIAVVFFLWGYIVGVTAGWNSHVELIKKIYRKKDK